MHRIMISFRPVLHAGCCLMWSNHDSICSDNLLVVIFSSATDMMFRYQPKVHPVQVVTCQVIMLQITIK